MALKVVPRSMPTTLRGVLNFSVGIMGGQIKEREFAYLCAFPTPCLRERRGVCWLNAVEQALFPFLCHDLFGPQETFFPKESAFDAASDHGILFGIVDKLQRHGSLGAFVEF